MEPSHILSHRLYESHRGLAAEGGHPALPSTPVLPLLTLDPFHLLGVKGVSRCALSLLYEARCLKSADVQLRICSADSNLKETLFHWYRSQSSPLQIRATGFSEAPDQRSIQ